MADNVKISELPRLVATDDSAVPMTTADGSQTGKVTLKDIAALGGGQPTAHTHSLDEVNGLRSALDEKANKSHTHGTKELFDFPEQLGHAGKVLSTNGSTMSWVTNAGGDVTTQTGSVISVNGQTGIVTIPVHDKTDSIEEITDFPSQSGQSGLFLTTDGTTLSWSTVSGSGSSSVTTVNGASGAVTLDHTDVGAAATSHSHQITHVTGLLANLNAKANKNHTHQVSQITDLPDPTQSNNGQFLKSNGSRLVFGSGGIKSSPLQANGGTAIDNIVKITNSAYTALSASQRDSTTLYIIVD